MTKDNEINISSEEIAVRKIKEETVSEMAKMSARQVYWQGFNAGIEEAAKICKYSGYYEQIMELKK